LPKKAGRFEKVGSAGIIACSKVLGVVAEVMEPLVDTTNDVVKREGKELLSNLGKSSVEAAKGINSIGTGIGNVGKGIEKIGTELSKSTKVVVKGMTENTKLLVNVLTIGIDRNYDVLEKFSKSLDKGISSIDNGISIFGKGAGLFMAICLVVFVTLAINVWIGCIFSCVILFFFSYILYFYVKLQSEILKKEIDRRKKKNVN
jgi:F420-0:gamma-glutamyl ligase-like protein